MKSSLCIRLIFLCIAVVLAAFAVYEYRESKKKESIRKQEALIFKSHLREGITKLSLVKQDGSRFIVEKTDRGWGLMQPVKDQASSSAVEGLLDDLFDEEAQVLSEEEDVKWSDYDLDPPFSVLNLHGEKEKWEIGISGESSFDGKFYIKKNQKLLLASSKWSSLSRPWTDTYRSKTLYSLKEDISKLHYIRNKKYYELTRKNGKWQWSLDAPLSQTAVEGLVDLLKGDMISAFLNKKKITFLKPDLEIQIFSENQKNPWTLKLKKINKNKAHVILSNRDFIYELNTFEPLLAIDFEEKKQDSSADQIEENTSETK